MNHLLKKNKKKSLDKLNENSDDFDPLEELLNDVRENASKLLYEDDKMVDEVNFLSNSNASTSSNKILVDHRDDDLGEEETLSDISDCEIEKCMLTEEERNAKALIWDELTKNIMPVVYRRMKEQRRKMKETTTSDGVDNKKKKEELT